ncbi:MAG: MgtC/SapB family protein [Candidatus Melainabacteria bacterium]|nr:MgtC/SapB family protein [Candidatus Melainabacteria bacterium]
MAFLPHLLVALVLGAILGAERRLRHKVAGVRTHMVMSASACIITLAGVYMAESSRAVDPTRLAAQVLAGIGFVGAGVILRRGSNTSGITTASTILFASGVGIAAGFGYFGLATLATGVMVVALLITYRVFPDQDMGGHSLKVTCPLAKFEEVKLKFGANNRVDSIEKLGDRVQFRLHTSLTSQQLDALLSAMINDPDIIAVDVVDEEAG